MPRITRVYTRTGDDGSTALGGGRRVDKDSERVEAYGAVDELSSCLGTALATGLVTELAGELALIQNDLFHLGSDLAVPQGEVPRIEARHVERLEGLMDRLSAGLPALDNFVLPGGAPGAAALHVARSVCRRAERRLVALARKEAVGPETLRYLNRLSDALFVMARHENARRGSTETLWDSRA